MLIGGGYWMLINKMFPDMVAIFDHATLQRQQPVLKTFYLTRMIFFGVNLVNLKRIL